MEADGRAVYEDLVGRPWGSLSPRQRAIGGFGSLPIEVDNGGFDQYFYNSAGDFALEGLAAAEALNILRLADVLRRALEMLPGGYSAERTVRQAALRSTQRSRWTPLNKEFYALEREIDFEAALNTLAADI